MCTRLLSFLALALFTTASHAQTVSDFESLSLSKPDTFYVNYNNPLTDVGFTNGLAYFSCFYDTSYGGFWSSGFAYSNMTDSVTSGYINQYSAKAAKGYAGSNKYAAATTAGGSIKVHLSGAAIGKSVQGFYVTNSTYAYNSMRDGDQFAKKFGGPNGTDPDWFKLTVQGYLGGALKPDTVNFYLADYRTANKILVKDWEWVNLLTLGDVDSLTFTLSSTDTAGGNGMNTPAFFCIDNFTTNETEAANSVSNNPVTRVYPNPAKEILVVETSPNSSQIVETQVEILNVGGQKLFSTLKKDDKMTINTANLVPGVYLLQLKSDGKVATVRFVKE